MSQSNNEFNLEYPAFLGEDHFSKEVITKNNRNIKNLRDLFLSADNSNPILSFVGAGISRKAGFCDWDKLLNDLEDDIKLKIPGMEIKPEEKKDNFEYAQRIKEYCIRNSRINDYYDFFKENFKTESRWIAIKNNSNNAEIVIDLEQKYETFIQKFVNLPFKGFITTNYEKTLAASLMRHIYDNKINTDEIILDFHTNPDSISEFERSIKDNKKKVLYIHGTTTCCRTIILAEDDYRKAYNMLKPPEDYY